MWYKRPSMTRRGVIATLLVIIAVQFAGGIWFASVCPEPCADDGPCSTCTPICTSCTHAQQAIVRSTASLATLAVAPLIFHAQSLPASSQLAADIFHVPLFR